MVSINRQKRDVIEYPVGEQLDINGWDLKKNVTTITKNKSTSFGMDWITDCLPRKIFYRRKNASTGERILFTFRLPLLLYSHGSGKFPGYLQGDMIWVKKYFYVLRPILAMKWIEEEYGIVPTDFNITIEKLALDAELKEAVSNRLASKRSGNELDKGEKIPAISNFIQSELERWEHSEIPKSTVTSNGNKLD